MKSSVPGIGPVQVLEHQDDRAGRGEPLEQDTPAREQLVRGDGGIPHAQQGEDRGLDPGALLVIGDVPLEHLADLGPRLALVGGLREAASGPDHLAQGPERHAAAVRRGAAVVPPDGVHHAVEVLLELPRQAALAHAGRARDRDEAGSTLAGRRMEEVLEHPDLLVATHERGLEELRATPASALGDDPQRPPRGDWMLLALEHVLAGFLEGDRCRRSPVRGLAHQYRPGAATDWIRAAVLTRSPATMPWSVAPSVTAASPVSTPARALMPWPRPLTASRSSSAARTARSASSSRAVGVPTRP